MAFFLSFLSCGDHLLRRSDSFVCAPLSVLTFFICFFFFLAVVFTHVSKRSYK